MKEKIYTIPINDAFDTECACPICEIERKIDLQLVESTLGASMMEADYRIITNERGFCKTHYAGLIMQSKALPLSLIMQTHSEFQNKKIISMLQSNPDAKKSLFKKTSSKKQVAENIINAVNNLNNSCAICEKTNNIMTKFLENIIFLWKTENEFRDKFNSKKGFCLPHFAKLLEYAVKGLNENDFNLFLERISSIQISSLNEIYNDVSQFAKLFDHRSSGMPSIKVKTAVKRSIHTYSGLMLQND